MATNLKEQIESPEVQEKLALLLSRLDTLNAVLGELEEARQDGRMEALNELLGLVVLMRSAFTDDMVKGLVRRGEKLLTLAFDPTVQQFAGALLPALHQAEEEFAGNGRTSMVGLLRDMNNPEVQRGLSYFLDRDAAYGEGRHAALG